MRAGLLLREAGGVFELTGRRGHEDRLGEKGRGGREWCREEPGRGRGFSTTPSTCAPTPPLPSSPCPSLSLRESPQSSPSPALSPSLTPPRRHRSSQGGEAKPSRKTIALSDDDTDEEGGGEEDGDSSGTPSPLMTLSQAVSPVEGAGKRDVKRRRLHKVARLEKEGGEGGRAEGGGGSGDTKRRRQPGLHPEKEASGGKSRKRHRESVDGDSDGLDSPLEKRGGYSQGKNKGKGRGRECDFDKATYRRFIDTEAEVDEDVSDDDEAALENDYDSEDSFVNDGPLSYFRQHAGKSSAFFCGVHEGSIRPMRSCSAARFSRQTNNTAASCSRRAGHALRSSPGHVPPAPAPDGAWKENGRRGADHGSGRGDVRRGSRAADRFGFINAVMAHAREGGDPLEVEEACGSEGGGFTQEGYAESRESSGPPQGEDGSDRGDEGRWGRRRCSRWWCGGGQSGDEHIAKHERYCLPARGAGGRASVGAEGGRARAPGEGAPVAPRRRRPPFAARRGAGAGRRPRRGRAVRRVRAHPEAGLGLPREVTGPSLTPAQNKFLPVLLRAPTLSYSGGLFILQAFRGQSAKDVIARSAREFQAAVPGMTAQQAAKMKRHLASAAVGSRR
ncbi:unnamed protein product [Scytosiphon promiscuus]